MIRKMALVGYGSVVLAIDLAGNKPLTKKVAFRHYQRGKRYGPEVLVLELDDQDDERDDIPPVTGESSPASC